MDALDEKVLLESCCFILDIIRSKSNEKEKGRGCGKYLNKEQNKEFTIIYYKSCVSMIDNHISGYLYNELFSESDEEKYMVFQRMA